MQIFPLKISFYALCIFGSFVAADVQTAPPASSEQESIQQLQKQVEDLNSELVRLKRARGAEAQNQAMQHHWGMMQDHMRSMRQMPGMSAGGCANWQMMDPNLMGPEMMGQGMTMGCPMMGHDMEMGPGMMGWAMPPNVTPNAYQKQTREHMQTMRSQMAAISAETDPAKRQALMREHYAMMYRDMQTMRGMGLYLHTGEEWDEITSRMRAHISDQGDQAQATAGSVKMLSAAELDAITTYLDQHAR